MLGRVLISELLEVTRAGLFTAPMMLINDDDDAPPVAESTACKVANTEGVVNEIGVTNYCY